MKEVHFINNIYNIQKNPYYIEVTCDRMRDKNYIYTYIKHLQGFIQIAYYKMHPEKNVMLYNFK